MKSSGWKNTRSLMQDGKYLIGRQPILNRSGEVEAYELLFRSAGSPTACVKDASQATASVIVNTLTGFGLENILGNHKGFLNLELELLMDDTLNILPKGQIVLELLETLSVTPELIKRCRFLKESGFTLALDDHAYDPAFHELYQIVDIVKVDLIQSPIGQLEEMVQHFRPYPLQLLAEKVETREQFDRCLELGFDLFQGYYFAKPSIMEMKRLDDPGSSLMELSLLLDGDAELVELEHIFLGNAGLTNNLLILVNSIGICTLNQIDTVRNAISILGRQQVKRWVQLALCAG
jgi:EAL and modified HD-GYP domain-containing signal transduction protein